jgi:predicted enzyme related to lactoylglutathione lyase
MSEESVVTPMHIAITVSDFDRSVAFYTGALGFTLRFEREDSVPFEPILQLHDVRFREGFLVLGGMMIALMAFENPECIPAPKHAFNQTGIKDIAFGVPDIDEAAQRIIAHGGKVLEHTRSTMPQATLLSVTDPDGTYLALVQRTVEGFQPPSGASDGT